MQFVQLLNPISVQDKMVKSSISESGELAQTFQNLLDSANVSEENCEESSQLKENVFFSMICQKLPATEVMNLLGIHDSNVNFKQLDFETTDIVQGISQEEVNDETNVDAVAMLLNTALDYVEDVTKFESQNQLIQAKPDEELLNEFLQIEAKKESGLVNGKKIALEEVKLSENIKKPFLENNNKIEEGNLVFNVIADEKKNLKDVNEKNQLTKNFTTPEMKELLENNKTLSENGLVTEDESAPKTEISTQNTNQINEKNDKAKILQQDQSSVVLNDKKVSHSLKEASNDSTNYQGNQNQDNNNNVQSKLFGEALEKSNSFINEEAKTPIVSAKEIPDYFFKQITSKVKFNKLDGTSELNIKLKPDYLGKLTLKLTSHEGQVAVKILTETTHAREFVEQNIQQLKQNLINQGIKCSAIDVQLGGESSFHFFGQFKNPFSQSKNYSNKNKAFKNNEYENQDEGSYSLESRITKSGLSEVELLA